LRLAKLAEAKHAHLLIAAIASLLCAWSSTARADILHAPISGRPIPIGPDRVACGTAEGGWVLDGSGRTVRPPNEDEAIGRIVELRVAENAGACESGATTITLIATDRFPDVDEESITLFPDEGRVEARGRRLLGSLLSFRSGSRNGNDECRSTVGKEGGEECTWTVAPELSADPANTSLWWLPRGARLAPDAIFFDTAGRRVPQESLIVTPARVVLTQLSPSDATVDLATGAGHVPLTHPEAVSRADCGALTCTVSEGKLLVRGGSRLVHTLEIKLSLAPRVFVMRKDSPETQVTLRLPVLHCPMTIISGPPIRQNDEAKIVLKLEGGCARELPSIQLSMNDRPLRVMQVVQEADATYVLLKLGNVSDEEITITALRGGAEGITLAVARAQTRVAPSVRASLELGGYRNLSFIPNNVPASVHVTPAGEHQRFALLPIEGVYTVGRDEHSLATITGDPNAAGLTDLRFGIRADGLPEPLRTTDLAIVRDPLQRSIKQANIPTQIGDSLHSDKPLVEMLCGGGNVPIHHIEPGVTAHLPFSIRDTCRVVFHREALPPEYGTQRIHFEIEVLRVDGSSRSEAHVTEAVTFRHGSSPRYAYIHGVTDPFDRIVVRVSHEADEAHYVDASEIRTGAPDAQWSVVMGTGRARLYGTTTIPTGLYRFGANDHSGLLSLNFGVISRLTWLDAEGREGFLGAEMGVLVFGLANSVDDQGRPLRQVGAVFGLGLAVPIANRSSISQASINLHAWFGVDMLNQEEGESSSSRLAFIFGPSISIGNVGANL
jgi:hypothetical protein